MASIPPAQKMSDFNPDKKLDPRELYIRETFWANHVFVIMDTETNGLDPKIHGPCEVAMLKIINGVVQPPQSWFVKTQLPIPPHVQAVHHITNEEIANAPVMEDLAPTFQAFCKDTVVVAHNAPFDKGMMPCLQGKEFRWVDNLRLARHVWPLGTANVEGHPLTAHKNKVLQHWLNLNVDTMGQAAHRAQADILVTAEIFREGVNRYLLTQTTVPTFKEFSDFLESPYRVETFMGKPIVEMETATLRDHLRRHAIGERVLDKDQHFSLQAMYTVKSKELTPEDQQKYQEAYAANQRQLLLKQTQLQQPTSFNTAPSTP